MTLYFDFVNGNDGNPGTELSPKKDVGVANLSGHTAIFFRGDQTHLPSARISPSSGMVLIGAYGGNSRPILSPVNTTEQRQVISANGRPNLVIQNLQFTNPLLFNTSCISVFSNATLCSGTVIDNVHFFDTVMAAGITMGTPASGWTSATGKATGLVVRRTTAANIGGHGLNVSGPVDGYIIEDCFTERTGTGKDLLGFGPWGIYTQGTWEKHEEAAWTQVDVPNNVWEINQTNARTIRAVKVPVWWTVSGLVQAWLTAGTYNALNEGEWGSPVGSASVQVRFAAGVDPTTFDVHVIHEWASNGIIRRCVSTTNQSVSEAGGDGNGIGGDLGAQNLLVHDCESFGNSGSGFSANQTESPTFIKNKSYNNGVYGFRANNTKTGATYYHNVAVGNVEAAFRNQTSGVPFVWTARNNVGVGGKYSISFAAASTTTIDTITENKNVFHGASIEAVENTRFSLDASDITADAKLSGTVQTVPSSAGYRQGAFISAIHTVYSGPWDGRGAAPSIGLQYAAINADEGTAHVDSGAAAGGDGSQATPFDTFSDLTWAAGNFYHLKHGSTFTEILTLGAAGVTVQAYGSGARPKIDSQDVRANGVLWNLQPDCSVSDVHVTRCADGANKADAIKMDGLRPRLTDFEVSDCDAAAGNSNGVTVVSATQKVRAFIARGKIRNVMQDGIYAQTDGAYDAFDMDIDLVDLGNANGDCMQLATQGDGIQIIRSRLKKQLSAKQALAISCAGDVLVSDSLVWTDNEEDLGLLVNHCTGTCVVQRTTFTGFSNRAFRFNEDAGNGNNGVVNGGLVVSCIFRDNNPTAVTATGCALDDGNVGHIVAQSVFRNNDLGIRMGQNIATSASVYNSIFAVHDSKHIRVDTGSTLTASNHNLFGNEFADGWQNQASVYATLAAWQAAGFDAQSLLGDPKFRNVAANDYRLDGDSPGIGAGIEWWTGLPPEGEDGVRFSSRPEIGAYAFDRLGGGAARGTALPARVLGAGADTAKARAA